MHQATRREQKFVAVLAALLVWMLVRSLFAGGTELSGFAALLIPAVVPFVAILRQRRWAASIVTGFVLGMVCSSALAIYEFVARQFGLPWMTDYVASVGGVPRSAALSFEAAYFAAPAVAALIICWAARPTVSYELCRWARSFLAWQRPMHVSRSCSSQLPQLSSASFACGAHWNIEIEFVDECWPPSPLSAQAH